MTPKEIEAYSKAIVDVLKPKMLKTTNELGEHLDFIQDLQDRLARVERRLVELEAKL